MKFKLITLIGIICIVISGCTQDWPSDPPDVIRPEITSVSPAAGSFLAQPGNPISLSFSEPMDVQTFNSNAIVMSADGDTLQGTWSEKGMTYSFAPNTVLQELNSYKVNLKGSFNPDGKWLGPTVRDKKGNSLENDYSFDFATINNIKNTTLYFGRSDPSEYEQSGLQKGIGYVQLSDDAHDGSLVVKTIGEFDPGELRPFLNPAGDKIFVTENTGNKVWLLNPASNQLEGSFETGEIGPSYIAFTPDGNELWVLGKYSGKIVVMNSVSGAVIQTIELGVDQLNSLTMNHAGTKAYATTGTSGAGSIVVLDVPTRTVTTTVENIITGGQSYAFSNDIFVSDDDSKIYFLNEYAEPQIRILNANSNTVEDEISLPSGGADEEWLSFREENIVYLVGRWGTGGITIDLADKSIKSELSSDFAECYLGVSLDPGKKVLFAVGTPTWDSITNGVFSILRASDLKKLITLKTINDSGADLPWRFMIAR